MASASLVEIWFLWRKCSSTTAQLLLDAFPLAKRNEHTLESFKQNFTASHTASHGLARGKLENEEKKNRYILFVGKPKV